MAKLYIKTSNGTKGSQSMKRLAEHLSARLGYKVLRSTKELVLKRSINYGAGVDKLAQFKWFAAQEIPALLFTVSIDTARGYVENGHVVFGRKLLNSSCGKGIVVMQTVDQVVPCPVYTIYRKKKREFRVHIFKDKVVAVKEKKQRADWDGPRDTKIRNLANGYVFCTCDNEPAGLRELALKAAPVVASDFAGVDIGYNEHLNELFVIEVNSAPGIEGSNVEAYANAILEQ